METPLGHDQNADQIAYWNGPGGQRWAERQETLDVLLEHLKDDKTIIYKNTAVKTGGAGPETKVDKVNVKEEGTGDARMMAVDALTEIGPEVIMTRPDIVRQLRAIAANPNTDPDVKKTAKALVAKLVN